MSEFATFSYQCTALYDRAGDAGIRWNDADIGIDWPISAPLLSDKDGKTPLLADVPAERLPVYVA
jgi:dTDP-4-dehydrorhamnose 3,5-epimerase